MNSPAIELLKWKEEAVELAPNTVNQPLTFAEVGISSPVPLQLTELEPQFASCADNRTRDQFIERYAYLVKITAERVIGALPPTLDRDDLVSAGIVGLIKAVDRYNPARQVKFETYAIALIRGAIQEMLREEDWVPRRTRNRIGLLQRTYMEQEMKLGRPASDDEMAVAMNVSLKEFQALLFDARRTYLVSLEDVLAGRESGEDRRRSEIFDDNGITPPLEAELRERQRILGEAIDLLPDRERQVAALYYYEGMTFHEIANILIISTTRVYQLHTRAMLRLRGYLQRDMELFQA